MTGKTAPFYGYGFPKQRVFVMFLEKAGLYNYIYMINIPCEFTFIISLLFGGVTFYYVT